MMKNKTRNTIAVLLGLGLVLGLGALMYNQQQEKKVLSEKKTALELALQEKDSAYNEIIEVMYAVETKIQDIKQREKLISEISGGEVSANAKDDLIKDMGQIDRLILETNKSVDKLMVKLNNANLNLTSFKSRIAKLTTDLEERKKSIAVLREELKAKDVQIADMTADIQSLEYTVDIQEATITSQENKIELQSDEMNKAYFAIGTEKALEQNGVVTKEGGVLWFGKTTELQEDADQDKFSEIDIRTTNRLLVDSKEVDLITEHPASSYDVIKDGDKVKFIEIKDPAEFWKISKYLVVAVKS
ncbi:MAG: hypothetical protein AAF616_05660 [Bacteroidota bacterium]